ncbi:dihydroorotate dehydrogenase electron transfer subunit [Rubrobacter marinus]|uniref:Dihydroorotate dehydrogenase electron transfer subunit n=1 Tax=Rubrobacter marinus TaxID=2653852 RepID=A0A6G8PWA8_9ACTN|nr:dihydroorotate dehydrogenase electron transfer subunit [Rubrobacter marinus]QIN78494.1 dihydroorotate dehydrogenase electron transfer subunit [Rubrobacter marinus]
MAETPVNTDWKIEDGVVVENGVVGPENGDIGRVVIEAPGVVAAARPGHFVMLRTWEGEPFLPRAMAPLSYDVASGRMEIFYRIKGPGTRAIARTHPGEIARVTGPLGRPVVEDFEGRRVALVGRGVGITPLLPLAEHIVAKGGEVRAYLSARTRDYVFGHDRFAALGPVRVRVDDEDGDEALVTDALARECEGYRVDAVYGCGSWRLTRAAEALGVSHGFPSYVFLESKMGCGVGYCKGCPARLRNGDGYKLVCVEGPVFPTREVELSDPVHGPPE